MKNAIRKIFETLNSIDLEYEEKITKLENRVEFLEKERALLRKNLQEGRLDLVKDYLYIEEDVLSN